MSIGPIDATITIYNELQLCRTIRFIYEGAAWAHRRTNAGGEDQLGPDAVRRWPDGLSVMVEVAAAHFLLYRLLTGEPLGESIALKEGTTLHTVLKGKW